MTVKSVAQDFKMVNQPVAEVTIALELPLEGLNLLFPDPIGVPNMTSRRECIFKVSLAGGCPSSAGMRKAAKGRCSDRAKKG